MSRPAILLLAAVITLGCTPVASPVNGTSDVPASPEVLADHPASDAPVDIPGAADIARTDVSDAPAVTVDAPAVTIDASVDARADVPRVDAIVDVATVDARADVPAMDIVDASSIDVAVAMDVPAADVVRQPVSQRCFNCALTSCGPSNGMCTRDPDCVRCVNEDVRGPGCAGNAALQAALQCACSACPAECQGECLGVDAGARPDVVDVVDVADVADVVDVVDVPDVPFNAVACANCGLRACSTASARCALDATCQRCALSGDLQSPSCRANSALMAVLACACPVCSECAPACVP